MLSDGEGAERPNVTATVLYMPSARFVTAVHLMTMLGLARRDGEEPVPAPAFAFSVGTNPVVIRRLVGVLREAGLVEVARGPAGGVRLARDPEEISLADIAAATAADRLGLDRYAPGGPSDACRVAPHIAAEVARRAAAAEAAFRDQLAAMTLGSLVADVHDRLEVAA